MVIAKNSSPNQKNLSRIRGDGVSHWRRANVQGPTEFAVKPRNDVVHAQHILSAKNLLVLYLVKFLIGLTANSAMSASAPGLMGYWQFYEGTGTDASDHSGKENTATLVNGPTWNGVRLGNDFSFNGVDQYVAIFHSNSLNNTKNLTGSAWV